MENKAYSKLAIIGLITSIYSLVPIFTYGWFISLVGIIISTLGLVKCNKLKLKGENLALIGIILGAVAIFFGVLIKL